MGCLLRRSIACSDARARAAHAQPPSRPEVPLNDLGTALLRWLKALVTGGSEHGQAQQCEMGRGSEASRRRGADRNAADASNRERIDPEGYIVSEADLGNVQPDF